MQAEDGLGLKAQGLFTLFVGMPITDKIVTFTQVKVRRNPR